MTLHFAFALMVSAVVYGVAASLLLLWLEKRWRTCFTSRTLKNFQSLAMDQTVNIVNFANAVTATVLSSWALITLGEGKFDVTGGRAGGVIADYTLGSVCGYIIVELSILYVTSIRLRTSPWSWVLTNNSYREMVVFHIVALIGLISVVIRDTGYPLGLWVVWSELTTVFIGLEQFMTTSRFVSSSFFQRLIVLVRVSSGVLFVVQRVVVFYYLLWLCWRNLVWDVGFMAQLILLIAGTILNTHMACAFVTDLL